MYADLTSARVLADSVSPAGSRLVTVEATFPRFILAEWNTHRALSRNSASSRARPLSKTIEDVLARPFVPQRFPVNKSGMSADEYYVPGSDDYAAAVDEWISAMEDAVGAVRNLATIGVHKQIANRLIEPFMYHTAIITAEHHAWEGVFTLRIAPEAQPEFRRSAERVRDAIDASHPKEVDNGQWHLPLVGPEYGDLDRDLTTLEWAMVSAARCGRVSYLTHTGIRDVDEDLTMARRLALPKHLSPFEHPATPAKSGMLGHEANAHGWHQLRSYVETVPIDDLITGHPALVATV